MPLPEDQIEGIKQKIIQQIESWDKPQQQKQQAIQQIKQMNSEQLENFLKQNNLIQDQDGQGQQCPFCSLSKNKEQTFRVGENHDAVAILELKPISKGHTIVIPKEHVPLENFPEEGFKLAKKIVSLLKQRLNPQGIRMTTGVMANHSILNIIPITGEENKERKQKSPEELKALQKELLGERKQQSKQEPRKQESKQEPQQPEVVNEPRRVP